MSAPQKRRSPARPALDRLRCTWLTGDLLIVSGLPPAEGWEAVARTGRKKLPLEPAAVMYSKPDRSFGIVLLRLAGHGRKSPPDAIVLSAGGAEIRIDRSALATSEISLEQLISEELAGADTASRAALQARVHEMALPALELPGGLTLAGRLRELRDALRDPLRPLVAGPEAPQAAGVELIMAVDDRSFWVVGWVRDADRTLSGLIAVTPEGWRADLLGNAYRHSRPDVELDHGNSPHTSDERPGFITYLRLPHPSLLQSDWLIELHRTDGSALELPAPTVMRDLEAARIRVLDEFSKERADRERLRTDHALPALARLQERHARLIEIGDVIEHGTPPETPAISVVVPLYGRVDFIEHQLVHFGWDPQLAQADLVYVLDSPELAPQLEPLAAELHALHRIPFRIVKLVRNAGFSGANNVGVSQARGRLVLLLNSDVIPVRRGWLERMAAFYDSTPEIGALGPKLLFEDLSIQHAGMYFKRERGTSLWGNMHYFKGFHRDFPDACVSRPVPGVTGACMMVARELYQELGGLRHGYVQGGYEDSDFCIRLVEKGRRNWYLAEVELYHLEAQSFPSPERRLATLYNTWLQTHLWDETIDRIMHEQGAGELASTGEVNLPTRLSSVG